MILNDFFYLTNALSVTECLPYSKLRDTVREFLNLHLDADVNHQWVKNYIKIINDNEALSSQKFTNEIFSEEDFENNNWMRGIYEAEFNFDINEGFLSDFYRAQSPASSFIDVAEPIIQATLKSFNHKLSEKSLIVENRLFKVDVILIQLRNKLAATLYDILYKTLILELNVSRLRGELTGNTSQDRFNDFNRQLRTPEKRRLVMQEYPVAFRKVFEFGALWEADGLLFLEHLTKDWDELHSFFGIESSQQIGKIRFNAGDRHNGGHAVTVITFGSGRKIVYKPRSLATDIHFQSLLDWVNKESPLPNLRTLAILDKESYGWTEYIEHTDSEDKGGLFRYYQRIGQLLAILYCINATDFHFENLIAEGENPVLIDLESLFNVESPKRYASLINEATDKILTDSVLKIQLLPFKLSLGSEVLDLSALSNPETAQKQTLLWHAEGSDEMSTVRGKVQLGIGTNIPKVNGKGVGLQNFDIGLIDAFSSTYDLFRHKKEELLQENGLIKSFQKDSIRILIRPTEAYAQLLRASLHPDYLRIKIKQELLLSRLWNNFDKEPDNLAVAEAEMSAIEKLDIPLFTSRPDSLHLWADGKLIVKNYFNESGLSKVERKIHSLSADDLHRQIWFIQASLASTNRNLHSTNFKVKNSVEFIKSKSYRQELSTKAIDSVAKQFEKNVILQDGYAQWLGVIITDGVYDVKPLMLDLYSGIPGIAIFLASLVNNSNSAHHENLFRACIKTMDLEVNRYLAMNFTKRMGAFDGWAGILYSYILCGQLVNDTSLISRCKNIAAHIMENISAVEGEDIISGRAGVLLSLIRWYNVNPSSRLKFTINELMIELLTKFKNDKNGRGCSIDGMHSLVGFGHGVAGIIYAINEANKICPVKGCYDLLKEAVHYESSQYVSEYQNWMDYREFVKGSPMIGWCTGAAGIGLSRLNTPLLESCSLIQEDIDKAVNTTIRNGFGANVSLCHGDSGNLDFLLQASIKQKNCDLDIEVLRQSNAIANRIIESKADFGIGTELFNPALMVGAAGAAYQLLRVQRPGAYPSILLLQTLN